MADPVLPALIAALVALGVVVAGRLSRRRTGRRPTSPPTSSPITPPGDPARPSLVAVMEGFQDLDARRARGELDDEAFRREEAELQADFRRWAGREDDGEP